MGKAVLGGPEIVGVGSVLSALGDEQAAAPRQISTNEEIRIPTPRARSLVDLAAITRRLLKYWDAERRQAPEEGKIQALYILH